MSEPYAIQIGGTGYTVAVNPKSEELLYKEILRTPLLERQSPEAPTGELDFGVGWPYPQRDWSLGEQQYFTHEYDSMGESAPRRYQEGHGIDQGKSGELSLLKALTRTLPVSSATCPMCVDRTGATVYAFPAGTLMYKYAAAAWTSETITSVTSPVLDCVNAGSDTYIIDSTAAGSRVKKRTSAGTWSAITPYAAINAASYNDATAVIFTDGMLFVLTPNELYNHTAEEIASDYVGGSIACTHAGGVFFSDGSNRVYLYNGTGTRLIIEDLPTGFQVQSLFNAHARLWICGQLPDGKAAMSWYAQGQWGPFAWLDPVAGSTRSITAGAATAEHVLFSDSRYGGIVRHYAPEGGWSHYLAYGSAATIPYKGLTVGAGRVALCLYGATTGHTGTAQATGNDATHTKLAAGASASNDAYNGLTIAHTAGTGAGQSATISDYDGTTKIAVHGAVATPADDTTVYVVGADGIYVDSATAYVTSGVITGSQTDTRMPAHLKAWFTMAVKFQPLTTGQSVKVEWSKDGGTTWAVLGTNSTVGATEANYALTGTSATAQYRLTLYSGATATTTPKVLAVTVRGNPIVTTGRRWQLTLDTRLQGESMAGQTVTDNAARVATLKTLALAQTPTTFVDILGASYTVVIRPFAFNPAFTPEGAIGSTVDLVLDQLEGS